METRPVANVLGSIERAFAYLVERDGFSIVQSTEVPSFVWYRLGDRTIVVSFDFMCDAAVDVHLEVKSTGERHLLADILAFEPIEAERRDGLREPSVIEAEIARAAELLRENAGQYLNGNLDAFRRRFREALLVKTTRASAMREFYDGDPRRSRDLFEALRAYWTDLDCEHVARLSDGARDKSLAHLRLKT